MYKNISFFFFIYGRLRTCACVCVCVCVCVCEREREREREKAKESQSGTSKETLIWDTSLESLSSSCFVHGRLIQGSISTRSHLISLRASAQNGMTSNLSVSLSLSVSVSVSLSLLTADWLTTDSQGWKLQSLYIFRTPTHSSYVIRAACLLSLIYRLDSGTHPVLKSTN